VSVDTVIVACALPRFLPCTTRRPLMLKVVASRVRFLSGQSSMKTGAPTPWTASEMTSLVTVEVMGLEVTVHCWPYMSVSTAE
jgi:hypothetical protein